MFTEAVGRGFMSVKNPHSCLILDYFLQLLTFNPLSPHDALKRHFTSLKTDLIFLELGVLERKFP